MKHSHNFKDLTGQRFGRLEVLRESEIRSGLRQEVRWLCRCDCGIEKDIPANSLRSGHSISCGCYREELRGLKHGLYGCPEYSSWAGLRTRCLNPNSHKYRIYGGRGITVCERWNDFGNFMEDMGRKPTPKHTIERKDRNGNYEPSNCIWATQKVQQRNRSTNRVLTFNGASKTMADFALEHGMSTGTLWNRINLGWSVEDALTRPLRKAVRP